MKNAKMYACLLSLFLAGCQVPDEIYSEVKGDRIYSAMMEEFGAQTKTSMDGLSVVWSAEDKIVVFDGNDAGEVFKVNSRYIGESSAEFEASSDQMTGADGEDVDAVVAVYPYGKDVCLDNGADGNLVVRNVVFPSEQKYVPSSFAQGSFPMVAMSSENDGRLQFRNLGGVLHLRVTGKGKLSRIILEGNSRESVSGTMTVSLKHDGLPSVMKTADASPAVTLICDPAVELSAKEPVDFYISVAPVEFSSGFTVSFWNESKEIMIKRTIKPQSVRRSAVLIMPTLNVTTTSIPYIDLGLSVMWADRNVGAGSKVEYGKYYAWGELKDKSNYTAATYQYYDSATRKYTDIGKDICGTRYDVAKSQWGAGWRMPSREEIEELVNKCRWVQTTIEGVGGHEVVGPNGNSIFIPNTGYMQGTAAYFADDYMDGRMGFFRSGTLGPEKDSDVYILNCEGGMPAVVYKHWDRRFGIPVRPVRD